MRRTEPRGRSGAVSAESVSSPQLQLNRTCRREVHLAVSVVPSRFRRARAAHRRGRTTSWGRRAITVARPSSAEREIAGAGRISSPPPPAAVFLRVGNQYRRLQWVSGSLGPGVAADRTTLGASRNSNSPPPRSADINRSSGAVLARRRRNRGSSALEIEPRFFVLVWSWELSIGHRVLVASR